MVFGVFGRWFARDFANVNTPEISLKILQKARAKDSARTELTTLFLVIPCRYCGCGRIWRLKRLTAPAADSARTMASSELLDTAISNTIVKENLGIFQIIRDESRFEMGINYCLYPFLTSG